MAASLAVAVFFWSTLILAQGEMLEKTVTAQVQFTASPANLVLVGDKLNEVRLHLAGPKSDLDSITPVQVSPKIDLSQAVPGKQTFVITNENIRLPRGVRLLDVAPSSLELTLAEVAEHEVAIEPQIVGKLPFGLRLVEIKVKPSKLRVMTGYSEPEGAGPTIITTPIFLDNIYETTKIFCKLITPPAVQPVEKRWPDVEVMVVVEQRESH
jgi:hypothetical protein